MRRPAEGVVPLFLRMGSGNGASAAQRGAAEPARLLKLRERGGDEPRGLKGGGEAGPQWPEGRYGFEGRTLLFDGIVVKIETRGAVPAVFVHAGFPGACAAVPDCGG